MIVELNGDLDGEPAEGLSSRDEIGGQTDLLLELRVGPLIITASMPMLAITAKCCGS
jgi:hypothetical protein